MKPDTAPDGDGYKIARQHMASWGQSKSTDEMMGFFVKKFARQIFDTSIDYFTAEDRLFACLRQMPEFYSYERASAELSAAVIRYGDEAARTATRIRVAVAPLFVRRVPAETIKQTAISLNKNSLLSASELSEILKSEYEKWKINHPATMPNQKMATR